MTKKNFEDFTKVVALAGEKHPVWWRGFEWLNMNDDQIAEIRKILNKKCFIVRGEVNGTNYLEIPSGIRFFC